MILATLAAATLIEKRYGTEFAAEHVYGSAAFLLLWLLFSASALLYLLKRKIFKKPAVMALHFSFLLILAGALVTRLFGEHGALHLREGEEAVCFTGSGEPLTMPFAVKLNGFRTVYYPGSEAPMDYVSAVTVTDAEGRRIVDGEVAMNRILSCRGYRFCQSGYDEDGKGVTLAVAHDPVGIAVTYAGYLLLLLSIASFFLSRRSRFRRLVERLKGRGLAVCLLLLCACRLPAASAVGSSGVAQTAEAVAPKALPRKVAEGFGDLYVLYNGRICPLQTLAKDFTVQLCGRSSYRGLTAEQVFTGWMFYHSSWKAQPMIKVKSKAVRRMLGINGGYASLDDFYDSRKNYKLAEAVANIRRGAAKGDRRGVEEADEKFHLIALLYSGRMIKMFPCVHQAGGSQAGGVEAPVWYSRGDALPGDMADDEWLFVRKSMDYLQEMAVRKDFATLSEMLVKIKLYQQKKAGRTLPSDCRFHAEKIYSQIAHTRLLAMTCLAIGIISFLLYAGLLSSGRRAGRGVEAVSLALSLTVLLYLAAVIGLRWYVSRHVPLSNGFETMHFMALSAILLSLLLRRRFFISPPFGFLLCGLALLVAMIGESGSRITHPAPILSSPLLSIHVVVIMTAYSLFAFMMLNGLTAVILPFVRKDSAASIRRLSLISRILLYPAVFCLATGIFAGAVWANNSWGRYWGWDPKEVWALITLLIYSAALHTEALPQFGRPMFFHLFAIAAFLSVLITYFGVNLVLGGMHGYA
jgi:ABC-type transport system involved in cytochrome c biogenesis permease subunit